MIKTLETIAAIARDDPGRPAICEDGKEVSYKQLEDRSSGLAHAIQTAGVAQGSAFLMMRETMTQTIIAMLAGLKAGTGFQICDYSEDPTKLRHMIDLAKYRMIIAEGPLAADALKAVDAPFVLLETLDVSDHSPLPEVPESAPAFIESTSGSTGLPKLVYSSQATVEHYVSLQAQAGELAADQRVALLGEGWIDTVLAGLHEGAQLEAFDFKRRGVGALAKWMRDRRVTTLQTFVAAFRAMAGAVAEPLPDLRIVRIAGEAVLRADVETFERITTPGAVLMNMFGATECGFIAQSVHAHGDALPDAGMPVGRLWPGTHLDVLDETGAAMPDGAIGALRFRAPLMPEGYLNNPAKTAETFGTDEDGLRTLVNGDLGFRDAEGVYHLAGRSDDQVKIRGYSVRYSEIEAVLAEKPEIADVAVTSFVSPHGTRQLSAHLVPAAGADVNSDALRRDLQDELPAYMVPTYVLTHEDLPRTGTGKVLRRALPNPLEEMDVADLEVSSLTRTEAMVAEVWAKILGHRKFAADQDFFDVGGDSLQAMSMVLELEQAFTARIGYESLIIEGATLRGIATRLDHAEARAGEAIVPLQTEGDEAPLYLLPVENGEFSDWLYVMNAMAATRPVFGVHVRPQDQRAKIAYRTVNELATYAAEAILEHDAEGPHFVAGFSSGAQIAFETAKALQDRGHAVAGLILIDPPVTRLEDEFKSWSYRRAFSPLLKQGKLAQTLNRIGHIWFRRPTREMQIADEASFWRHVPEPAQLTPVLMVLALDHNPTIEVKCSEWSALCGGNVDIAEMPGDHMTVIRDPHAPRLAAILEDWMAGQG